MKVNTATTSRGKALKAGLPPGSLVHLGSKHSDTVSLEVIDFGPKLHRSHTYLKAEDVLKHKSVDHNSWINICGLHDIDTIATIGTHFGLGNLLLEDILDTRHRPKVEIEEGYVFITLKMLGLSPDRDKIITEQVSIVMGENWLISFQEQEGDIFDTLRQRLSEEDTAVRNRGVDYLLYRLIDTVIDYYFHVMDYLNENTEDLEDRVNLGIDNAQLEEIQDYRKDLISLRRSISPLRETIASLSKEGSEWIKPDTLPFLRDVYEHIIQINDSLEAQREVLSGIRDLHMTGVSNRMNQIMQLLTIISTIFIPLTFIAGIYGMNFVNIPELQHENGYFIAWGVMIALALLMVIYFRRKKWL